MTQPLDRSRPVRASRRLQRHGALALLAVLMIATLIPAAVAAADRTTAPDRSGGATVIPQRVPDRGVAVDPVPTGTIGIQSSIGYFYGGGEIAVVGEVLNNASARRRTVNIEVTYYNINDGVVGTITDVVLLDRVSRGAVGPFLLVDDVPPQPACPGGVPATCIDTYAVRVASSTAVTTPPAGVLQILDISSSIVGDVKRYTGTIRNPNSFAVIGGIVNLTAYTSGGDVVEVTYDLPNGNGDLGAGASAPFVLDVHVDVVHHHARIQADAFHSSNPNGYVTSWSNYFDDLGTTSFRGDIVWLAEQGITSGCAAGRYCPTANVRRDEMASFLSRALDLPPSATNFFTDDNGNTHEPNINKLAEAGITGGCAASKYCPTAVVRRDAMASFLARALELGGTAPNAFTDDNGNTHEANINRLAAAGVTSGCGGTNYCPTANVNRAQMAAFLRRAFE